MSRPRSNPEHGTYAKYSNRTDPCRCQMCKDANSAYQRAYKHRGGGKA